MSTLRSQMPLHFSVFGLDGKMTQPWAFWFEQFVASLPPSGSGFVIDGSAGTYGPSTLYQGPAAYRSGSPSTGDIYVAVDTGDIYVAVGGVWVLQSGELVGDVTKPANSNVTELVTITTPGTVGSTSTIPVLTVDAKGRVISATEVPAGNAVAAGVEGSVQINSGGILGFDAGLNFDVGTSSLTLPNGLVTGALSFTTPDLTLNNLLPAQAGAAGDVLATDGTNTYWTPSFTSGLVSDYILSTESVLIPPNRQYIVVTRLTIDGIIDNQGTLAIL